MNLKTITPVTEDKAGIVFIADGNYTEICSVAIKSLIDNLTPGKPYDIVMFTPDGENVPLFNFGLTENVSLRVFNIEDYVDLEKYKDIFYIHNYISVAAYYRLFIPDIFPEYSKILYLDCDTIVYKNLDDLLYNTPFKEEELIGMVPEFCYVKWSDKSKKVAEKLEYYRKYMDLDIKDDVLYFNSGVVLFDIQKCRKFDFVNRCMSKLKDLMADPGYVICHDQDILNCVLKDKIHPLSYEYNILFYLLNRYSLEILFWRKHLLEEREFIRPFIENCAIMHYAGPHKAWEKPYKDYAFTLPWWKVAKTIPSAWNKYFPKLSKTIQRSIITRLGDGSNLSEFLV